MPRSLAPNTDPDDWLVPRGFGQEDEIDQNRVPFIITLVCILVFILLICFWGLYRNSKALPAFLCWRSSRYRRREAEPEGRDTGPDLKVWTDGKGHNQNWGHQVYLTDLKRQAEAQNENDLHETHSRSAGSGDRGARAKSMGLPSPLSATPLSSGGSGPWSHNEASGDQNHSFIPPPRSSQAPRPAQPALPGPGGGMGVGRPSMYSRVSSAPSAYSQESWGGTGSVAVPSRAKVANSPFAVKGGH